MSQGETVHSPVIDAMLGLRHLRGRNNQPYGESTLRHMARAFSSLGTEWVFLREMIVDGKDLTLAQAVKVSSPDWNGVDVPSREQVANGILFATR